MENEGLGGEAMKKCEGTWASEGQFYWFDCFTVVAAAQAYSPYVN